MVYVRLSLYLRTLIRWIVGEALFDVMLQDAAVSRIWRLRDGYFT